MRLSIGVMLLLSASLAAAPPAIPNVAADRENIRRNAVWPRDYLAKRGFSAEILETTGNPLVFGELKVPGAARTMLFYVHYDGQPVNPKDWKQPSPFTPILRDGRVEDGAREIPNGLASLSTFAPDLRIYAVGVRRQVALAPAGAAAADAERARSFERLRRRRGSHNHSRQVGTL